jgi:UDP:flavonoid glycosyltransferase YjiC (YdhE family)
MAETVNQGKPAVTVQHAARKPHVVACAAPVTGHTMPMLAISAELVKRGFTVTFLGGEQFRDQVERIGARLVTVPPWITPEQLSERSKIPAGLTQLQWDMRHVFIEWMGPRWKILNKELEDIKASDSSREVVVMSESLFIGAQPLNSGCPLPKGYKALPKVVAIHAIPYITTSWDIPPPGVPLPPDYSEEGRAKHKAMYEKMNKEVLGELIALHDETLANLGCTIIERGKAFLDVWTTSSAVTLQMCPRSAEFYRTDHHPKIKYTGALTPAPLGEDFKFPDWWADVTTNRGGRKIVAVSQGTVAQDYTDLLIPTIRALSEREDILVVAFLGSRGARLPVDVEIPANTRVVDYLRYDAILPHADAWVTNAGYGSFIHGIVNGVPMILAGESEDKPEVSKRGAHAGIAINMETGHPTSEQLSEAIDRLLTEDSFKKRVLEVQKDNEEMRAMDTVERELIEYAKGSAEVPPNVAIAVSQETPLVVAQPAA